MSLINEALKKAQRQRHENASAGGAPEAEPGGPIAKRAQPKSANSMLLLGTAAVVLVVASMVGTALWLTRSSKTDTPPSPKAVHSTVAEVTEVAPKVSLAVQPTPVATTGASKRGAKASGTTVRSPAETTASLDAKSTSPAPPAAVATSSTPATVVTAPPQVAAVNPAPKPAAPKPDERIHQFVESLKVAGIRSSGPDSKVLMNDRVYRVNDYVDRSLGVRLTKVSSDSLTFTDENGATYVKYF